MSTALENYRRKRDFKRTTEPQGGTPSPAGSLRFVVQKHAARHLHYDFRLELDGTLKSWAVPKGPSLDPADKRMAVEVEDHPLAYADFEGVIPPKQYGAGTVIVWDHGEWSPIGDARAGHAAGRLKFELHGQKLQGRWTLVRMRGRDGERQTPWLLIKERDALARPAVEFDVVTALRDSVLSGTAAAKRSGPSEKAEGAKRSAAQPPARKAACARAAAAPEVPAGARRAVLPLALAPQLATLVERAPPDGAWTYEMKFDGYRLLARIDGADVRLFTRNGHDWTSKLRSLAQAVAKLGLPEGWLDGEIVVPGPDGTPDFQRLQNAFDSARTDTVEYFVFDLPYFAGHDLRHLPLQARRDALRGLLDAAAPTVAARVRYSEDFPVAPADLLHTACELRLEGLIGKRVDAPYVSARSTSWIKLKCTQRQEFVIGGYALPQGTREGIGSLLLGVHDAQGRLRYAGKVGSGFDRRLLLDLRARLDKLRVERAPFEPAPAGVKGPWVRATLVAEVSFAQWTQGGHIRHAVFHGLRSDKPPRAVTRERPADAAALEARPSAGRARSAEKPAHAAPPPPSPTAARKTAKPGALPAGVRLTHPQRVIDASTGITKLELATYYQQVSKRLLPQLLRRPVSLVRGPEGVGGELFFQKHAQNTKMPGVRLLDPSFDPDHAPLLEMPSLSALLAAVQMNTIEFHTWNASTRAIDQPDRMSFDLDPGERVPWSRVQEAAQLVRALLLELGLESWLKTSGGKGLHVIVPLRPAYGWDAVKGLSQAIVRHLAVTLPERFVAKSGPRNRVGKIFADYLRNGRGATTVAAWSARARPGMGVSVPVRWDELNGLQSGAHWSLRTVGERLDLLDPWRAAGAASRSSMKAAMKSLDYLPPAADLGH